MGFESFSQAESARPVEKTQTNGRVDFNAIAEKLNPELGKLEQQLSQLIQKAAVIREQVHRGQYPGKLIDLSNTENERDVLKEQIKNHPDFGSKPQGFEINYRKRS